ncbi:MAG: alpha/beta hydrolase-fold protein [Bacteroidota bacterium]
MKISLLTILLFAVLVSCRDRSRDALVGQMVNIGRKESLDSKLLNESRAYWVYVPPSASKPGVKLPVLYVLDGDAHFHSVSGLIQILGTGVNGTKVVPEMIVVAIPNTDRTRDLTPSHAETMMGRREEFLLTSGGGSKFLKFIKDELIPHIDQRYPTNSYRTLIGHSFGGITAINALYTIPETFDSYISIDPSLWWDNQLLLKQADSMLKTKDYSNKSLFIGQANTLDPGETTNEHFGSIKQYVEVLEKNKQSGLRWSYKYYPEDSHGSVPFISEYDGMRFIFEDFNPKFEKVGQDIDQVKKIFDRYHMLPPQDVLEYFGHRALAEGNTDLALGYLQMNIDTYPATARAQESMGEFLLTKGDSVNARPYYLRALQLDPENKELQEKVLKLKEKK